MTVSKEVIARILVAFLAVAQKDKELFHPKDVEMVQSNDWWIERFITGNQTEEESKNALIEAMEWRKSVGVNDFTEDQFKDIKEKGVFPDEKIDKEGRPIFWIQFMKYSKQERERNKQYMIYLFDKFERKNGRNGYTVVGDANEVVSANVDLDLFQFMIEVMQKYFPRGIKLALGIDVNPVMEEVYPIIVSYMAPEFREVIKLISRTKLLDYMDEKYLPLHLKSIKNEIIL